VIDSFNIGEHYRRDSWLRRPTWVLAAYRKPDRGESDSATSVTVSQHLRTGWRLYTLFATPRRPFERPRQLIAAAAR